MKFFTEKKKLEKTLTNQKRLVKQYGQSVAEKINQRLTELSIASTLTDISHLPPARLHRLIGDYNNTFAVNISKNWRIIFVGYNRDNIVSTIKEEIILIEIIAIEDYH
jgi:proteic killer suppression protein